MKSFHDIDWRSAGLAALRLVLTGISRALACSGRLLRACGTACETLCALAQGQAERLSSSR